MEKSEYIICSAIWFDDGKEYVHTPTNIKTGFVVAGRRHHDCFYTMSVLSNDIEKHNSYKDVQGFLTNTNRFVDRVEGAEIAFKAGQIKEEVVRLFSEDIY